MFFYFLCFYKDPRIQAELHLLFAFHNNSQKENLFSTEALFKHLSKFPGVLQFFWPAFRSLAAGQMTTSCRLVTKAVL